MRKDAWELGHWGRIPVSMHWTVLLAFVWMYIIFWSLAPALVASAAFLLLLVAHEFGHVFVLRRRRIPVVAVALYGFHGETAYGEYVAKPADEVAVAWGGVGAQALILVLALAFSAFVDTSAIPGAAVVLGPVLFVFIQVNIVLMILALLPIGPFDGHAAWKAIPRMRAAMRRRAKRPAPPPLEPTATSLTPEQQRELDANAGKEAAELLARLRKKSGAPTEDA